MSAGAMENYGLVTVSAEATVGVDCLCVQLWSGSDSREQEFIYTRHAHMICEHATYLPPAL